MLKQVGTGLAAIVTDVIMTARMLCSRAAFVQIRLCFELFNVGFVFWESLLVSPFWDELPYSSSLLGAPRSATIR